MRTRRQRTRTIAISAAAAAAAALYLVQPLRNGPNPVDEALLLGHVDALARGQLLHRDFIDLYGPVHWWTQALAYQAAGERVIGIRLWLLMLKAAGLLLAWTLVARVSGRFHAALCTVWLVLLLGVRWQLLQSPYPFLQASCLSLSVLHLLLPNGREPRTPGNGAIFSRVHAAGFLTGLSIWTKLNAGLFLLAAGLFVCAFLSSPRADKRKLAPSLWLPGLVAYAATFTALIWQHLDLWFGLYLLLPLAMTVTTTGLLLARGTLVAQWRPGLDYAGSAVATSVIVLMLSPGPAWALDYIETLARIITTLDYVAPLPAIGVPGPLVGFNEHYWPQLPWLTSAVTLIWMARTLRDGRGEAHSSSQQDNQRSQAKGAYAAVAAPLAVWVFASAHMFVIYSRPDESHIYQAMLLAVPALFVVAAVASPRTGPLSTVYRVAAVGLVSAGVVTLWAPPSLAPFEARPSPWANPRMEFVDFGPQHDPFVKAAFFDDRQLVDTRSNAAAEFLDQAADDGEQLLVLTRDELLAFNANMAPVGGRHRYFFYLLKNDFIDRAGFDRLAPPELLPELLADPPIWIMGEPFRSPILDDLPEIEHLLRTRYHRAREIGHVVLYRRSG